MAPAISDECAQRCSRMRSPPPPGSGAGVHGVVVDAARLDGIDSGGQDLGNRLGLSVLLRLPSGQAGGSITAMAMPYMNRPE